MILFFFLLQITVCFFFLLSCNGRHAAWLRIAEASTNLKKSATFSDRKKFLFILTLNHLKFDFTLNINVGGNFFLTCGLSLETVLAC